MKKFFKKTNSKKCIKAKLHLFNETMTDTYHNYLGLNTLLNLPEKCSELESDYSDNFPYTEGNADRLMRICSYLESQSIGSKLILFSDDIMVNVPDNFVFIGYDICADSEWYSPLGDGFLEEYDDSIFFSEMSLDEFKAFQSDLNESGLFSSCDKAIAFAEYCNCINKKYPGVVETEDNWRPFIVYLFERS
ncbi:MAG: hypothetical protein IJM15_04510 [Erysipelotrichaceae bacterium]|nr:hypothetical protein [Erysipelotrichaceae bacterium]